MRRNNILFAAPVKITTKKVFILLKPAHERCLATCNLAPVIERRFHGTNLFGEKRNFRNERRNRVVANETQRNINPVYFTHICFCRLKNLV